MIRTLFLVISILAVLVTPRPAQGRAAGTVTKAITEDVHDFIGAPRHSSVVPRAGEDVDRPVHGPIR